MTPRRFHAALLALLLLPATALAERYRVDLIVFIDDHSTGVEVPRPWEALDPAALVELDDAAALRQAGIELLPDEAFGLTQEWNRLRNSRRHQPILRLAWLQRDPPIERGPALRLRWGPALPPGDGDADTPVLPVDGSAALLLGRFLHLDLDLRHTAPTVAGERASFHLRERRRMRRDELHHFDSPRVGVLARVVKAPEETDDAPGGD